MTAYNPLMQGVGEEVLMLGQAVPLGQERQVVEPACPVYVPDWHGYMHAREIQCLIYKHMHHNAAIFLPQSHKH